MNSKVFALFAKIAAIDKSKEVLRGIARGYRNLSKQTEGVRRAWSRMSKAGGQLAGQIRNVALGAVAAAGAAFAFAKRTSDAGDRVAKISEKLGVGVQTYQELEFAAGRARIGQDTFAMALQRFTRRAAEAAAGTGEAKDALSAMNIKLKNSDGTLRPAEALLGDVAESLSKIPDKATRVRIAFKLFDSEGVSMVNMLGNGRKGLDEMRGAAREFGAVLSQDAVRGSTEFQDKLTNITGALRGLAGQVFSRFLPQINAAASALENLLKDPAQRARLIDNISEALSIAGAAAKGFGQAIVAMKPVLIGVVEFFGGWKNVMLGIAALFAGKLLLSVGTFAVTAIGLVSQVAMVLTKLSGFAPFFVGALKLVGTALTGLATLAMAHPILALIAAVAAGAIFVIANWETVSGFFETFWSGLTSGFAAAFGMVRQIVNGATADVLEKVNAMITAIPTSIRDTLGIGDLTATIDGLRAPTEAAPAAGPAPAAVGGTRSQMVVRFENAPPGTRVDVPDSGGLDLATETGISMAGVEF